MWAPIFSEFLLHHMPVIDAEREASIGDRRTIRLIQTTQPEAAAGVAAPERHHREASGEDHGGGLPV
jgi:hypothetical protein